ncbi:CobW family GTP-binding protein [Sunxiuqinia elliptica]|uniref:GTPase, G3E family n=1 Tax=Sunxiuqinia elliptica TaxID=655355 RepID=A0A1I2K078_9BACT|nr:GTP-binding protein [Sunxiuqinia elliptica]SFF60535.1 GTPase, G3E family [Sunxiuqinia elliptica]
MKRKIPAVLVTGFLGAGKTTFLNEVIREHQHLKMALVENEFGQQSIDQDLIVGMQSENVFDLSNGCICCSISNEFSLTLLELASKTGEIDFLLVETTGIADLANVIKPFYEDRELKEQYTLAGSVCLVDAANFDQQMSEREQQMQVILSDLLIINKTELVSDEELKAIEKKLTAWNGTAKIIHSSYGKVANFRLEAFSESVQGKLEKKMAEPVMFRLVKSKKYTTFTHEFPGTISISRFKYWFDYFAAINQREIYRIKGILFSEDSPNKVVVQSVGGATSYSEGSLIVPGETPNNRLVFIGKEIDFERIGYELDRYLTKN